MTQAVRSNPSAPEAGTGTFTRNPVPRHDGLRLAVDRAYRRDEAAALEPLIDAARLDRDDRRAVQARATTLVDGVRSSRTRFGGLDRFLQEYGLTTKEGVALMCLAEALLRIPDSETADALIEDKIGTADWETHLGRGEGLFVNASTWALMLTGRVVKVDPTDMERPSTLLNRVVRRTGEPVIRQALRHAMKVMGRQFVMGRTIQEALDRARATERQGYRYSYDMLGEAARTEADAQRYYDSYRAAIEAIGREAGTRGPVDGPGISVKLSALHPRYETTRREDCLPVLIERTAALARMAKRYDIGFCVDAEEADRLDLSLDVLEALIADPDLDGWQGFGCAVQAYQKRAPFVLDWLIDRARAQGRRLMIRLVKGAYWDSEIKWAQVGGLSGYPVFTRKANTDVSYLACARKMLAARDVLYPQFATHNAHTVAYIEAAAGGSPGVQDGYEFQRLHGMGEPLFDQVVDRERPVRVYAPVGSHEDLLAYLVRRLLENGANSSFVNRLQDDQVAVSEIVEDPVERVARLTRKAHPQIPLPVDLYDTDRRNSRGLDQSDPLELWPELTRMERALTQTWQAWPLVGATDVVGRARPVVNPADHQCQIGQVVEATAADAERAMAIAADAWRAWDRRGGDARAAILERVADLLEENRAELIALCTREAGKTLEDGVGEVREAADFCRYYAARAREQFGAPRALAGPTGEENTYSLHGRGVFVCISPWNFPLAIFTGQIAAALVAGNAVVAKPAEQTPLVAHRAVQLFREAGVPPDVLHLLPGDGPTLGRPLLTHPRLAGVAFTGSTETARLINRLLAERDGPIVPLIAETGGQNALIADSTALPEQLVVDVVESAFKSAGQRCSALRVLFVPEGSADRMLTMLKGYAETLRVGDPALLETDIGPVIDAEAQSGLQTHADAMARVAKPLFQVPVSKSTLDRGTFFAPRAVEIDSIDRLEREVFGPFLHVVRYQPSRLTAVLEAIEGTGYGLTLGIHSRIDRTVRQVHGRVRVGNTYVNRNIVGAVVGVQPFGGHGLSGTGPKAGGPNYLARFANESVLSVDTTAAGGNASLVSLEDGGP